MKTIFALILLAIQTLHSAEHSIVFIHIGNSAPDYIPSALHQARLFNHCPIYLVANQSVIETAHFAEADAITLVSCESLNKSPEHLEFIRKSELDRNDREGFWFYTSERFLYLDDLMAQYGLQNVFHLENDNMLYADVSEFLPIFQSSYPHIGATFDNDQRCIPGFVYVANQASMQMLSRCFARHARKGYNDMQILARFRKEAGDAGINFLPIVMPEYIQSEKLLHVTKDPLCYCRHFDRFQSLFDAAALGQYLGGEDPRNGSKGPGFVNESCIFNPSQLTFTWGLDEKGRLIPFATYGHTTCRINNLHIHCKKLEAFKSIK